MNEVAREFGDELKRERQLREIETEEISRATKVSARCIEALESGQFERLPALVFSRGFVRAIATHLGLDGDRLVAAFSHAYTEWEKSAAAEKEQSGVRLRTVSGPVLGPVPRRLALDKITVGLGLAATLVVLVVTGAILRSDPGALESARASRPSGPQRAESGPEALALPPQIAASTVALPPGGRSASEPDPSVSLASPPPSPPVARPVTVPSSTVSGKPPAAEGTRRGSSTAAEAGRAPVISPVSLAEGAAVRGPAPDARPGALRLSLVFSEDCWAEVFVDGRKAAAELFRRGTRREFSGSRTFSLTLGDAGAVKVTLNGEPVPALGAPGEVVRNVRIGGLSG